MSTTKVQDGAVVIESRADLSIIRFDTAWLDRKLLHYWSFAHDDV